VLVLAGPGSLAPESPHPQKFAKGMLRGKEVPPFVERTDEPAVVCRAGSNRPGGHHVIELAERILEILNR